MCMMMLDLEVAKQYYYMSLSTFDTVGGFV